MSQLFEILASHCGPKSSVDYIYAYVIADSEEDILTKLSHHDSPTLGMWLDRDAEDGLCDVYDDNYNIIGQETYLEKMLRIRGEIHDPDLDFGDAYYGIHLYGWSEGKDISLKDINTLLRLKIAEDWRA